MPTQQEQIDWLVKQVNKINDAGCGCEDCSEPTEPITPVSSIIPQMKVSYGKAFKDDLSNSALGEPTTRTVDLIDELGAPI